MVWIGWQLITDSFVPAVLLALSPLVLVPLLLAVVFGEEVDRTARVRALCWAQLPCAAPLVVGLSLSPGVLAFMACLPWAAWTALAAWEALVRVWKLFGGGWRGLISGELAIAAGLGFPVIGSGWLLLDRLAIEPLGFSPLIVLLTAVHFHHAGLTLPLSAGLLARWRGQAGPWPVTAVAVVVAVPLVAIGITASPIVELVGAWLTAAAAISVALGMLARARLLPIIPALLSAGAGACLLAAMVFAASYALGEYQGVAWPDIASMIRLHGAVNALGFGLLGAWAWHLAPPAPAKP